MTPAQRTFGDIQVEVIPDPAFGGTLGPTDLLERFHDRADELGAAIVDIGNRLKTSMERRITEDRADGWNLEHVVVELSLNLEAEAGVVVCKGKTAAAFKVQLTWAKNRSEPMP
jgi:hypothetical protein